MIIARTPFRISFTGGGSDLRACYAHRAGAVVSATINRYMYVTVSKRFDSTIRVSYTRTEIIAGAADVQHDLVREAMRLTGVENGVEVTTIADVPAGTGLGSSSSLTVGLLHALSAYQGRFRSAEQLAQDACRIETDLLARPIGKQDQYAAAYGGLNYLQFNPDETVFVEPIVCARQTRHELSERLQLFYIAARGEDSSVLAEQNRRTLEDADARALLHRMSDLARETRAALQVNDLDCFGGLLHENWLLKKRMHQGISSAQIDGWYDRAREAGALGGKVLGAGGAGFLMCFSRDGAQQDVRDCLQQEGLRPFPMRLEPEGSKVVLLGEEG